MAIFGEKKSQKTVKKTTKTDGAKKLATKDLYGATTDNKPVAKTAAEVKTRLNDRSYKILVKPLVTEKASMLGTENKYVFAVSLKANKIEVAKAIESAYGVKPVKVNILNNEGKVVRFGRVRGKRKDWKKAIITLPEGKTIEVYEGV